MLVNPYEGTDIDLGLWFKANFHTHAGTAGDRCRIEEVIAEYRAAGYKALTISNQDILTDTRDYSCESDITLLPGFEYTEQEDMLCIGINELLGGDHQAVIDACGRQGGFSILCHPNWQSTEYWNRNKMLSLKCYTGIEIYNAVIFRLSGSGLAADAWDFLLTAGKLVWGFANDDFHRWSDMARAWNVIHGEYSDPESIRQAVFNGRFYCSTGLSLKKIVNDGKLLEVQVDSGNNYVKEYRFNFIGEGGKLLSSQCGTSGIYRLSGNESYVRIHAESQHGAMLWTQPLFNPQKLKCDFHA